MSDFANHRFANTFAIGPGLSAERLQVSVQTAAFAHLRFREPGSLAKVNIRLNEPQTVVGVRLLEFAKPVRYGIAVAVTDDAYVVADVFDGAGTTVEGDLRSDRELSC
jgi:hypothetical protein